MRCNQRMVAVICLLLPAIAGSQGFPFGPKKLQKPDSVLLVHAGTLLTVPGEVPLTEQTVVIRNELISEIRSGYASADDIQTGKSEVEVLDLREYFVMPGMFDAHVHLALATGSYQAGMRAINSSPPTGEATVNAMINARLNLAAGFTAVRDLGSDAESVFAVRNAINNGYFAGPAIIASGPSVSVTAGHGDDAAGSHPDERARAGVCDGPDECRTLTRYLEKTGSDLIKIKATGGFSSNSGVGQHMTIEEMRAIISAAHLREIKVTAHAYDHAAINDALDADVDSIEHGYLIDDAALRKMKRDGVFLVPTLTVAEPPSMVKRFLKGREPISVTMRNEYQAFERAYDLGVKIAFGTDAGIYPHGRNADELVRMVELGMTTADAIRSATVVAAELFGIEAMTGTIEPDAKANIIAVQQNPLADISALQSVPWVIASGQVVKRDGQMLQLLDYGLPQRY